MKALKLILAILATGGICAYLVYVVVHLNHPADLNVPVQKNNDREMDLTFTQRSPLSDPAQLARRLNLEAVALGEDYDLSKRPFKAYIPKADPSAPYGIFVYLNYKDSVSVAVPWEPLLDKNHLIFITPVCHFGEHFPNSVPMWQMLGLAFDAVDNLSKKYKVDSRRIYLMSNEGSTTLSFAAADVFTGLLIMYDAEYFHQLNLLDGRFYKPTLPVPPRDLYRQAKSRSFVLINKDYDNPDSLPSLVARTMREEGFAHVMTQTCSLADDIHYPNFSVGWFETNVLPFLDQNQTPN